MVGQLSKGQETWGRHRGRNRRGRERLKGRAFTEPVVWASSNRHPKASEGFLSKSRPGVSESWMAQMSACSHPAWQGDSLVEPFCKPNSTQLFWDVRVTL